MLDAAKEAISFLQGKTRISLDDNRMLTLFLVKEIEIIGEAATRISKDCRDKYPHIPWESIINMRNRLIHAYFDINLDVVWQTVEVDVPSLIMEFEKIVIEKQDPG
ncbi:HepT-like ribonuclease domain-containing protein [Candidatus Magnetominusculus xianensis]|nr:HepT-like ribonuclease domain-containing protein [Candidatus Magnetominusculus xianensis]